MERLLEKQKRNLKAKAVKYHDDPQRKKQAIKKRYEDEKESIKQNKKNLEVHLVYGKCRYHENPENKISKSKVPGKSRK